MPSRPRVRLRAGVMRYHVLTAGRPERTWRPSGLIDFEPAMHGEREYESVGALAPAAGPGSRFGTRTLTACG